MDRPKKLKPLVLRGVLPYNKAALWKDIFAGVTLAAVAIPVDMGYAKIAGMPVVTGLYALLLPCVAFALFGASRHLVVGADSASAAILAAGVASLAAAGSPEYASYAALLAVMVGLLLLVCRVFRLGFIARFLSRTVLVGFLSGVGIQVALSQLPELLGIDASGNVFEKVAAVFTNAGAINATAAGIAVLVFLIVMVPKWLEKKKPFLKRIPWALIAIGVSIAMGYGLGSAVPDVGEVQGGLPTLSLPAFSGQAVAALLGAAVSITVVILTQSMATANVFAQKHSEEPDDNRDMVGLGAANLAAGFSGTFVVNGSPTKTEVADEAGSGSQIANLTAAGVVALVLLFFTRPLGFLPGAALAAVVFSTGLGLVDIHTLRKIYAARKDEFFLALATLATVVVFGAAWGILAAIALSLIDHIHRSYKPDNSVFHQDEGDEMDTHAWKPVGPGVFAKPGVVLYHFAASLYYANTWVLRDEVQMLASQSPPPKMIVMDFSAVADVDYTGGETLAGMCRELQKRGIGFSAVLVKPGVLKELDTYGITALVGKENIYPSIRSVMEKLR